jgi:hypothetical protein
MPIAERSSGIPERMYRFMDAVFDYTIKMDVRAQFSAVQVLLLSEGSKDGKNIDNSSLEMAWQIIEALKKYDLKKIKTEKPVNVNDQTWSKGIPEDFGLTMGF